LIVYDNTRYLSISEAAVLVHRSPKTVRLWYKLYAVMPKFKQDRLPPLPPLYTGFGRKKMQYIREADMPILAAFRDAFMATREIDLKEFSYKDEVIQRYIQRYIQDRKKRGDPLPLLHTPRLKKVSLETDDEGKPVSYDKVLTAEIQRLQKLRTQYRKEQEIEAKKAKKREQKKEN